jgi:hypothetical protein
MPAPGGMFKGYIRVTAKRGSHTIERSTGRGCGRAVKTEQEALELSEPEARRVRPVTLITSPQSRQASRRRSLAARPSSASLRLLRRPSRQTRRQSDRGLSPLHMHQSVCIERSQLMSHRLLVELAPNVSSDTCRVLRRTNESDNYRTVSYMICYAALTQNLRP